MTLTTEAIEQYIDDAEGPDRAALKLGPSVWFVIASLRTYGNDLGKVAYEFDVPLAAVEAAVAYYEQNRACIDARIELNQA